MPRKRPKVSAAEARAAVLQGMSRHEFCAKFHVHNALYYRARRKLGIHNPKPVIDDAAMRRLARVGLSQREAAAALGCCLRTVQRRTQALGIVWHYERKKWHERAEWADWEDPNPGKCGVVPIGTFLKIYRERGFTGTREYLGLGNSSVAERLARARSKGLLAQPPVVEAPGVDA